MLSFEKIFHPSCEHCAHKVSLIDCTHWILYPSKMRIIMIMIIKIKMSLQFNSFPSAWQKQQQQLSRSAATKFNIITIQCLLHHHDSIANKFCFFFLICIVKYFSLKMRYKIVIKFSLFFFVSKILKIYIVLVKKRYYWTKREKSEFTV